MQFHIRSFYKVRIMRALVVRKSGWFKRCPPCEVLNLGDIEVEILYVRRISKKFKKSVKGFVVSNDFREFEYKGGLMEFFPGRALKKIASRHGETLENLEVMTEDLSEKNREILISLSLEARFMTVHSSLSPENFDFLLEEAGISPKIVKNSEFCEKLTVFLGEDFLIKHNPSGKTYYDIKLKLPDIFYEYNLPEGHSIFSEYIKNNPQVGQNVKISDLMSK